MKKFTIIAFIFGVAIGYLIFIGLDEVSNQRTINQHTEEYVHAGDEHMHEQRDVTSPTIPTLDVSVYPDSKSGYNIHIITDNFTWTPERVNTDPVENEGHAHLYINNEKVARIYGPWFHLDDHHLVPGKPNTMRVTLNTNDHAEWSVEGNTIEFISEL
ncbi:hypothetical protein KC866_01970 [Patescibacteria group bacterium]|nr:hypothetical protein [Patescibacteria group bacterium]